jgi:aspartate ammonia-lyase
VVEWVNQILCHIAGSDAAIATACGLGQLQLNVMLPVIAYHLPQELAFLTLALQGLDRHVLRGMRLRPERCRLSAGSTLGQAILIGEKMGHVRVARWVREGAGVPPTAGMPRAPGEDSPSGEDTDARG